MLQKYVSGDYVSAAGQNRLIAEVERLGKITADYPLEVLSGQTGIHIRSIQPSFIARLTGVASSSPHFYSWVESYSKGDGTFADLPGGRQSAGGDASVPGANIIGGAFNAADPSFSFDPPPTGENGAIVWLVPGNSYGAAPTGGDAWATGEYLFWWHNGTASTGSTGSGSGGSGGSGSGSGSGSDSGSTGSGGSGSSGSGSGHSGSYPVGVDCSFSLCVPYISDIEIVDGVLIKHVNYLGWAGDGFYICEGCSGSGGSGSSGSGSGSGSGSSGPVTVDCCENELPSTLYVTLSGGTGDCDCLNDEVLEIAWDGSRWVGEYALCGVGLTEIQFSCDSGSGNFFLGFVFVSEEGGCASDSTVASEAICDPLAVAFTVELYSPPGATPCCVGTIEALVTETP